MPMTDELVAAFGELNDAAYAMSCCQLAQAAAAAKRLETARKSFYALFMQAVRDDAVAARDRE